MKRVLVAGIGNIFLGDDAFGVEAVRQLAARDWPEGVEVRDFGIRCRDLAYRLSEGWDAAILVDAAGRGGPPGTLYRIDLGRALPEERPPLDGHGVGAAQVLELAVHIAGGACSHPPQLWLVGCEPESFDLEGGGLSAAVAAALPEALAMVEALIGELLASQGLEVTTA